MVSLIKQSSATLDQKVDDVQTKNHKCTFVKSFYHGSGKNKILIMSVSNVGEKESNIPKDSKTALYKNLFFSLFFTFLPIMSIKTRFNPPFSTLENACTKSGI